MCVNNLIGMVHGVHFTGDRDETRAAAFYVKQQIIDPSATLTAPVQYDEMECAAVAISR